MGKRNKQRRAQKKREKAHGDRLKRLTELLRRYDPTTLLAVITSYSLSVPVGDDGVRKLDSEFTPVAY
jgi:hypothetical protein